VAKNIEKVRKMNIINILKFLFTVCCVLGCIYQLVEISNVYLQYSTTTMIKVESPESFALPAFTVCVWNGFLNTTPDGKAPKQAFDSGTKIEQHLSSCRIFGKSCDQSKKTAQINYVNQCFTLNYHNYSQHFSAVIFNYSIAESLGTTEMFSLDLKGDKILDSWFFIHSNDKIPVGHLNMPSSFYIGENSINVKNNTSIKITYKKTRVIYLSKPYETNCIDYRDIGFNSISDCFTKCKINISLTEYVLKLSILI